MYQKLVSAFATHPRDVHTVPTSKKTPLWYFVSVEKGKLCVEPGRDHFPKSRVKKRVLQEKECERVLELYKERKTGRSVGSEASENTYSQVYWYGIFAEMNL